MKRLFECIAALAALALAARAEPQLVDGIAAVVNGQAVTISEVMRQIQPYLDDVRRERGRQADQDAVFREAFRRALDDLENKQLILQKYRAGDQRIPPHAVDRYAAEVLENRFHGNYAELQAELARSRMTYTEWKEQLEERLVVISMRSSYAAGVSRVAPSEVARAYEARKGEFITPARTRVKLIAVPAADTNAVAECSRRLAAADADFSGIARELSADSRAGNGGDYGMIAPADELAPALAETVAAMEKDSVSGPVQVGESMYWLWRGESSEAVVTPVEKAWSELENELLEEKREAAFAAWIAHLRAGADIRETLPFSD